MPMACPVRPWPQSPTVPSMLFADEVGVPCMPGVFFDHVDEHTPNIETFVLERFTSHECAQTRSTGQNPTRLFTCSGMQVEELVRAVFGCPTVPHRLCLRRTKCLRPFCAGPHDSSRGTLPPPVARSGLRSVRLVGDSWSRVAFFSRCLPTDVEDIAFRVFQCGPFDAEFCE